MPRSEDDCEREQPWVEPQRLLVEAAVAYSRLWEEFYGDEESKLTGVDMAKAQARLLDRAGEYREARRD